MSERWLAIPDYEGHYEVSDLGNIRSVKLGRCRPIRLVTNGHGYLKFSACKNGRKKDTRVATAVLLAFVGPRPESFAAAHWNGVQTDNRLDNLRWASYYDNKRDSARHGTISHGSRHPCAKLTETDIGPIRFMARQGVSHYMMGKMYGIEPGGITCVVRGTTWKHVRTGVL